MEKGTVFELHQKTGLNDKQKWCENREKRAHKVEARIEIISKMKQKHV